jgi:hypothetical protein
MNGLENKRTSAVLFLSLLAAEGFPILGLSNSMADLTAHIVLDNATWAPLSSELISID